MSLTAPSFEAATRRIDPFLMSVLKSRFEAIVREMALVVLRTSRSAVIKNARDFSCAILTYDHQLVSVEDALPIHVMSMDMATRPLNELFDDVAQGDIFINNCPYTGGTHHADLIMSMPVFYKGEPLFWVVALSHHADTGAPAPSTYLPFAGTIFEEGMHFPCVRLAQNYKERADILRIGTMRNRVPELWLGDVAAQSGAVRTAERRIIDLLDRYGRDTVVNFVEDWFDYGRRCAKAAIAALPAGTWEYTTTHDPVPGVADAGIPVHVKVTVDPQAGEITVDVRDNIDNVPGGLNLSANTCNGSCRTGVFNNLDETIPQVSDQGAAAQRLRYRGAEVSGRHLGRHDQRQRPPDNRRHRRVLPHGRALWPGRERVAPAGGHRRDLGVRPLQARQGLCQPVVCRLWRRRGEPRARRLAHLLRAGQWGDDPA